MIFDIFWIYLDIVYEIKWILIDLFYFVNINLVIIFNIVDKVCFFINFKSFII